jgi:arylsulfatase A-like enzyme
MRVPCIAWWPDTIPSGAVTSELASSLDLLPTFASIAGAAVPNDRVLDGYDLSQLLKTGSGSPRQEMFFYRGVELFAVRKGPHKAHYITQTGYGGEPRQTHEPLLLYHLEHDPGERWNVANEHPEVISEIAGLVAQHQRDLKPGEQQLEGRIREEAP